MEIRYNVTGAKRKELVKVIANATGARAEYKFMPTCNYEIDYFTVTKDGTLKPRKRKKPPTVRHRANPWGLRWKSRSTRWRWATSPSCWMPKGI